jgi:hypothetical protein
MGQGQEIIADKLLTAAAAEGHWLLLQNTHLGLNYLTELEGKLTKAEDANNELKVHEDFRWACQGTFVAALVTASSAAPVESDRPQLLGSAAQIIMAQKACLKK